MRWMILIGHDEKGGKTMKPEEHGKLFAAYQKYTQDLRAAGIYLAGDPLQATEKGVRISSDGGKKKMIDGPFTESKEIVGGYFVIEARTRVEALEWAARCPAAHLGSWSYVELRPIEDIPVPA
ncbi:MAG TPA: YciI family protein [Polyangiaceae bacterium]